MGGHPGNHGAVVGGHRGERGAVVENMGPPGKAVVVRGRVDYKPFIQVFSDECNVPEMMVAYFYSV